MLNPTAINPGMAAIGKAAPATGLPPALASLPAGSLIGGMVAGRDGAGQFRQTAGPPGSLAAADHRLRGP